MNRQQEIITAAIVVLASVVTLRLMMRMGAGHRLPGWLYQMRTWWKAMKWTILVTMAVVVGSLVAAGGELAAIALIVGGAALFVEAMLLTYAMAYGPKP